MTETRGDFVAYERLLWRTLTVLSHRGFFVPPDEGRDLIHDFYLDAWSGLLDRFEPQAGQFDAYVRGAFYKYARRRLAVMDIWRCKLVDLEAASDISSPLNSPEDQAQANQEVEMMRLALSALPGEQRQALYEYATLGEPSERALAQRHKTTRYAIRRALSEGLANLALQLRRVGLLEADTVLAHMAWAEGRTSTDIANAIRMPAKEVQQRRSLLAARVRKAIRPLSNDSDKRGSEMTPNELVKYFVVEDNRQRARRSLRESLARVRVTLFGPPDNLQPFSPSELAILREHPERLGELYDALFPEEERAGEMNTALLDFDRQEAEDLTEAFELLITHLPSDFAKWDKWFRRLAPEDALQLEAGSELLQSLAQYGLSPQIFAEVFSGFGLLFEAREEDTEFRAADSEKPVLQLAAGGAPITLEDLWAYAEEAPGIPEGAAARLTLWTLSALPLRPYLIPGYEFFAREGQLPLVTRLRHRPADILAQWNRPAYDREPAPRLRVRG